MTQGGSAISEMHERVGNPAADERRRSLEFYLRPGMMTDAGADAGAFDELPSDIVSLVRIVQGLLVHERLIPAYGLELPDDRRREPQIRRVELMLRSLLVRDGRPLSVARPVGERLVGVCRHFTVLLVFHVARQGCSSPRPLRIRRLFFP